MTRFQNAYMASGGLPASLFTGHWQGGHLQGIALDREGGFLYCSFTTQLVKMDLSGRVIGWVGGLTGHLGCLCRSPVDGLVYGSLEYKQDAIGKGILREQGIETAQPDAFYVAIFDVESITRPAMDAERDGVMTAVCLEEVGEDYAARWCQDGREMLHRYGCSGIDGISFGPVPGKKDGSLGLMVAYGVYGDLEREDNDYQVLLCYDVQGWKSLARPLSQHDGRYSGTARCQDRYFVFTGNTCYGVQNLEYDSFLDAWLMAVYPGQKPQYPNFPFYMAEGSLPPQSKQLSGLQGEMGWELPLRQVGLSHPSGVFGWNFPYGSTGMIALGEGLYYFAQDRKEAGGYCADIRLYRWNGQPEAPFLPVL